MSDRIIDQWSDASGDYYVTTRPGQPYTVTGICHCGHTETMSTHKERNARPIGQWILACSHHDCVSTTHTWTQEKEKDA